MNKTKTLIVALTGNYGSGKSYILSLFKEIGAYTINSDELVRDILKKEDIKTEIRDLLGDSVIMANGELNRRVIGEIIFKDPFLRLKVEDILHPLVFKEIEIMISKLQDNSVVIVEVPVLFERGYQNRFQRVITVYADEPTIFNRLTKKGISKEDILKRWNSQFPYENKIRAADFVIDNSEGRDPETQVKHIYTQLRKELYKGE